MIRTSSDCFSLDVKCSVSFPFEDKHAVNEHHIAGKSHDATQKKIYYSDDVIDIEVKKIEKSLSDFLNFIW